MKVHAQALLVLAIAGSISALADTAHADFISNDLMVVDVGGTSDANQTVSILDYNVSGPTPVLVGTHTLPSTGGSALTLPGTIGNHDGILRFSSDGNYLMLAGYRANVGTANVITSTAAAVPRVIGTVSSNWTVNTSTALTDAYNGVPISAVVSDNGTRFWTAGSLSGDGSTTVQDSGGLRYVAAVGASTSANIGQTQYDNPTGLQADSLRNATIVNKQLYVLTASQMSFTNRGTYATTVALPTSGPQTMIPVMNDIEGGSGASGKGQELAADSTGKLVPKSDIAFAKLNPSSTGYDTAYTTGGKAEYEKWSLIGGTWEQVAVYNLTGSADVNALDVSVNSTGLATLFVATASGIYRFTDGTGYIGTQPSAAAGTFTVSGLSYYVTPPTGSDEFRGIAVVPAPEPSVIGLLGMSGLGLLLRRRRQSVSI